MVTFIDRIGEIREGSCGLMEIIKYNGCMDIKVQFKTGSIIKTQYNNFKNGEVKDPLFPIVYETGYLGIGKYKAKINCKMTIEYETWYNMIQRCYDPYIINKNLTYQNATICDEWLNFQNFAEWYNKNHYELLDEKVDLNKDIIKRGNKHYNSKNCSFVPHSINCLLIKGDNSRGKYPIGAYFHKPSNKYIAKVAINGKQKHLGLFSTPKKAFNAYKIEKEKQIKIMANKYRKVLNVRVYDSLMKYEVEIID